MTAVSWIPVAFVIAMTAATIGLGLYATRQSRTASDFFVAGRSVSVFWNASAISGEYLSAASFMGIAGLLMKFGYDVLWYPACYAAGYLFLLLFIAGPLRRFGAYTIPDFAEGRFDSPAFRKIAVTFVLFIGFFYTMPQMKGAGAVLGAIMNWPYWAGIAVVGAVITFNVAFGGMKGITFVQAFQYWAKLFAITVPVFVLMSAYGSYDKHLDANARNPTGRPEVYEPPPPNTSNPILTPAAPVNKAWLEPFGKFTGKHGYPLLYTYSLIIALICGTAGLPHILVRFYTNPDGRAAKRTTLWVMVMLGSFYVFPPIWGTLGRDVMPSLYAGKSAGNSPDSVVVNLPRALNNPLLGQVLSGITSAGAFAAFMSTFSGLLVSMSGALAHDIYGKIFHPKSTPRQQLIAFKAAAVLIGIASMLLGLLVEEFDITKMVGWAFAIAAASYFPLLLLGAWWRRLTMPGAASGMLVGGLLSLAAIVTSMLLDKKLVTLHVSPLARSLMEQPAIWGVPLSVGLMVVVSLATSELVPRDVHLKMLRLHAPEEMGLSKNYISDDAQGKGDPADDFLGH